MVYAGLMTAKIIFKNANKILVVGPIYDQIDKLNKIEEMLPNYDKVIINGSLCYPYDNLEKVKQRVSRISQLLRSFKVLYNVSQHDLLCAQYLYDNFKDPELLKWITDKPNVIMINFKNQTNLIVTGGGIAPNMSKELLTNSLETSFVSLIDNEPWQKKYVGLMGYVIGNNPLTNQKPKFYPNSAQLGNIYSENVKVYAQEVEPYGLKRTILL